MQHREPRTKSQQPTATNLAFYTFTPIERPDELRDRLESLCTEFGLKGTIIIAEEGINAMLAGEDGAAEGFVEAAGAIEELADVAIKRSMSSEIPFGRLDVKIKPEIVTMRAGAFDTCALTADHLAPETFRDWLRSGEPMVVVDTRNDYEYRLGTFAGAINPDTDAFHEFPEFVEQHEAELRDKKVVMFCTGGIRCEKATSWMLERGLDELYQLDGGVLNYFELIEDADRDWEGELFVFDRRVAVDTRLEETDTTLCTECGAPVVSATRRLCDCLA